MWEAIHGPILSGRFVLHTCDNPPCVNPAHLYLGSQADNARDRSVRARARAKLTASQVKLIREAYGTGWGITALAQDFDVSPATIHAIVNRTAWKHVE